MRSSDAFDLHRFVSAQEPVWSDVVGELRDGTKRTHWMWFVFPQIEGLGRSPTARHYGIVSIEEARAYLAHPVLGSRLDEATALTLRHRERTLREIFGTPDDRKFVSSMTLFDAAMSELDTPFAQALAAWNGGDRDEATSRLLRRASQ